MHPERRARSPAATRTLARVFWTAGGTAGATSRAGRPRHTSKDKFMNITEKLRGAMRRMAGVSLLSEQEPKRRTLALPSILTPTARRPISCRNLRRSTCGDSRETPVARKAINTIKDRIAGMRWRIQSGPGSLETIPDGASERMQILTENFGRSESRGFVPVPEWSRCWRM